MRGDLVVVRCWRDRAALMRVWQDDGQYIGVVAPAEFSAMEAGVSDLAPTGFPRAAVYWADSCKGDGEGIDFEKLRPY
jgi:hypothetical protein